MEFAEEIAFMGGERTERLLVEREYATVVKHENKVLERRWWFGCVEEGIIKWLWGSFGVRCTQTSDEISSNIFSTSSSYCALSLRFSSYQAQIQSIWVGERKVSKVEEVMVNSY